MNWINIVGVIIISVFYISYLYKGIALYKKGIKANRLGKGKKDKKTRVVEIVLAITTYTMVIVQNLSVLNKQISKGYMYLSYLGLTISTVGIIFFILAIIKMQDSWRAGIDDSQNTELVTDGIYIISRNPAFVGFDLFYLGLSIAFFNVYIIGITLFAVILFHIQILQEEKYLERKYGKVYGEYKLKTKRYL